MSTVQRPKPKIESEQWNTEGLICAEQVCHRLILQKSDPCGTLFAFFCLSSKSEPPRRANDEKNRISKQFLLSLRILSLKCVLEQTSVLVEQLFLVPTSKRRRISKKGI